MREPKDFKQESNIKASIQLALSKDSTCRVFNNPVGSAFTGVLLEENREQGWIKLLYPRRVSFGLHKGSTDLIGWKTRLITPEMVGQRIAQFLACEVKAPAGRASTDQWNFIKIVLAAGGLAGIARSQDEAIQIARGLWTLSK